jgi:CheY-like chemotaxis protein
MMKRKILLAEDDPDDQQFFLDFLQSRKDAQLLPIAENGVYVIELLNGIPNDEELPDLIILDHNMPKMNGLQTLQHLKKNERFAHIPVSIYSTYTDESLIKNGTQLGACIVIPKPVTREGYDHMIETLFKVCG